MVQVAKMWLPHNANRKGERQINTWRKTFQEDLAETGMNTTTSRKIILVRIH